MFLMERTYISLNELIKKLCDENLMTFEMWHIFDDIKRFYYEDIASDQVVKELKWVKDQLDIKGFNLEGLSEKIDHYEIPNL